MNLISRLIALLFSSIFIVACSGTLPSQQDSAEVQKQKARKAQQELASEIKKLE